MTVHDSIGARNSKELSTESMYILTQTSDVALQQHA